MNMLMKKMNREMVDKIRKIEQNKIKRERMKWKRERNVEEFDVNYIILYSLNNIKYYNNKDRNNVYLWNKINNDNYEGIEKEIEEDKNNLSVVIKKEDMEECMNLKVNHMNIYILSFISYILIISFIICYL